MTHQGTHAASVARTLAERRAGLALSSLMGAYITGSDAALCGIHTCPFDAVDMPDLADQWRRGHSDTLAFQAGQRRPPASRRLQLRTNTAV